MLPPSTVDTHVGPSAVEYSLGGRVGHYLRHHRPVIRINTAFRRFEPSAILQPYGSIEGMVTQFLKTTQIAIGGARTLPRRYYVAS